jgi:hypothetical protein
MSRLFVKFNMSWKSEVCYVQQWASCAAVERSGTAVVYTPLLCAGLGVTNVVQIVKPLNCDLALSAKFSMLEINL